MRADLLSDHAREKLGMSPDWNAYSWVSMPRGHAECLYVEITGAVAPLKPNGCHDWRKMEKSTRAKTFITPTEHMEWRRRWEVKTGNCAECIGTGKTLASAHADGTTTHRQCRKCGGTGKPQLKE